MDSPERMLWTPNSEPPPDYSPRSLAKALPSYLAQKDTAGRFQTPPHIVALEDKLLDLYAGKIDRLIVTMPPRHGKSTLISHILPAWWLGNRPHDRVMLVSYAAEFAATWGGKAKGAMQEWGPELYNVDVSKQTSARNRWEVGYADGSPMRMPGGMVTAGVGGALTGRGADLLIVDDPTKNAEEANSEVIRESMWDWFVSTAYTRLEPGGVIVIVLTRWHEDDLAGRILAKQDELGEKWNVLNLPAIAEDDDALGRAPGQPLWPERYPEERLEKIRRTVQSYWWSALYQQRPAPLSGERFKRDSFRYFQEDDRMYFPSREDGKVPARFYKEACQKFITVDLATSTRETADWTVISTWAMLPANAGRYTRDLLLLDVDRRRVEGPDIVPTIQRAVKRQERAGKLVSEVHIESTGFQLAIVQQARRTGLPIRELKADTDKLSRALTAQANMDQGKIWFRQGAHWLPDLENELLSFPNGKHDDQVDTVSYAAQIQGYGGSTHGITTIPNFIK